MSKFSLNKVDKSTWESFKFQEIAERISISVDPTTTELEVYVGLEHIDAKDIHIRRFGKPSDVTGNKLKCFRGDVIFGKRRAYQRKAAIVDFDGICSAHSFVFRAKADVIDPELFPFFLHSDQFMHRAVDISVGGLSPTINWGDLKNQEFLLPPKEEQKKLAELLWSMDDVIEKKKSLLQIVLNFKEIKITDLFEKGQKIKSIQIKDLYRKRVKSVAPNEIANETVYHYSLPSYLLNQQPEVIHGNKLKSNKILIESDTLLFSKLNPHRPKIWHVQPSADYISVGSTEWLPVFPNEEISTSFLEAYFSSMKFQNNIMRFVQGSSNSHKRIDPPKFYNTEIPIFSKQYIKDIEKVFETIQKIIKSLEVEIKSSQSLQKSLINQIF